MGQGPLRVLQLFLYIFLCIRRHIVVAAPLHSFALLAVTLRAAHFASCQFLCFYFFSALYVFAWRSLEFLALEFRSLRLWRLFVFSYGYKFYSFTYWAVLKHFCVNLWSPLSYITSCGVMALACMFSCIVCSGISFCLLLLTLSSMSRIGIGSGINAGLLTKAVFEVPNSSMKNVYCNVLMLLRGPMLENSGLTYESVTSRLSENISYVTNWPASALWSYINWTAIQFFHLKLQLNCLCANLFSLSISYWTVDRLVVTELLLKFKM